MSRTTDAAVAPLRTRIEHLERALEEMTLERDAIGAVFDAYTGDCDALQERVRALEATEARLRAALEDALSYNWRHHDARALVASRARCRALLGMEPTDAERLVLGEPT